jgi:hypothetical protein
MSRKDAAAAVVSAATHVAAVEIVLGTDSDEYAAAVEAGVAAVRRAHALGATDDDIRRATRTHG